MFVDYRDGMVLRGHVNSHKSHPPYTSLFLWRSSDRLLVLMLVHARTRSRLRIPFELCEHRSRSAYLWLENVCLIEACGDSSVHRFHSPKTAQSTRYKRSGPAGLARHASGANATTESGGEAEIPLGQFKRGMGGGANRAPGRSSDVYPTAKRRVASGLLEDEDGRKCRAFVGATLFRGLGGGSLS